MLQVSKKIIETYGLPGTTTFKLIHDGIDNDVYSVNAAGKRYVLRKNKRSSINKSIDFELAVLDALKTTNFPAPKILQTTNGLGYVSIDQHDYVAFEHITGTQYQEISSDFLTREIVLKGGDTLGRLHKITQTMSVSASSKRTVFTEIERLLSIPEQKLDQFDGYQNFLKSVKDFKLDAQTRINGGMTKMGIVHNDFRIQNLIFDECGDNCSVLDFDWTCPGPLFKDVGLAIAEWSIFDFKTGPSKEAIEQFISGYNRTSPMKISYDSELLFWICFACISDACTFFADILEGRYEGKAITRVDQCRMYRKFDYFLREKVALTNKKSTILFISNRFGYGPTIALTHVMRQFASKTGHRLLFAGSGICKEAFERQDIKEKIDFVEIDERNIEDIRDVMLKNKQDGLFLVSCLNRFALQAAHEMFIPNALIDPLTWFWNETPAGYFLADIYFSNNFSSKNKTPNMLEMPLILGPIPPESHKREYLLFNIGGTQNHLIPELPKNYLLLLSALLNEIKIPKNLKVIVAGGSDAIDFLRKHNKRADFEIKSLAPHEYISIQQRSRKIVSLAGTNSTFMSFALRTPVVFLLPQLLAHWKLTEYLGKRGYIQDYQEWSTYIKVDGDINLITEKESIILTERLSASILDDKTLVAQVLKDLQQLIDKDTDVSGQSRFVDEIGINGENFVFEYLRSAWHL